MTLYQLTTHVKYTCFQSIFPCIRSSSHDLVVEANSELLHASPVLLCRTDGMEITIFKLSVLLHVSVHDRGWHQ